MGGWGGEGGGGKVGWGGDVREGVMFSIGRYPGSNKAWIGGVGFG